MPPCPICHAKDLVFGHPDSAFVYQCRKCNHIFVAGILTPEQLTDMYSNYYSRSNYTIEDYEPYKEKSGFLYWLGGEEGHAYSQAGRETYCICAESLCFGTLLFGVAMD
jgi:hypothetical protein